MELTQRVTVQEGGRIEITLPETRAGEIVELTVSFERPVRPPRQAGSLRGKIHLGPEFDDPIPGMEDLCEGLSP